MTVRGLKGLQLALRRTRARFVHGALILLYHRVDDTASDPFSLTVHPRHFGEHLEVIRASGRPMRLVELVAAIDDGAVPTDGIVVTFDDGYVDNLLHAKPLLERHEMPATVFVTSGFLGRAHECWWDALARIVTAAALPLEGELTIDARTFHWRAADRQGLLRWLHTTLRQFSESQRESALRQLARTAAVDITIAATHRMLSPDELQRLADGGLVEIGAHATTHPVLSCLPPADQRREILSSKTDLEAVLDRPVDAWSYPYGLASDYTAETVALVKDAGYRYGCAAVPDLVRRRTNPFTLPRVWIHDCDGEGFARQLRPWLQGKKEGGQPALPHDS